MKAHAPGIEASESGESACPTCGSETFFYCSKEKRGITWNIRKCGKCGHGFVANRPTLEMLSDIYAHEITLSYDEASVTFAKENSEAAYIAKNVTRLTDKRGAVLDVGSGPGEFSYCMHKVGFKPVMIDLDPRSAWAAKKIPNAEFHLIGLEAFNPAGRFDAIIMSQVLEHALDPAAWLRKCRELINVSGVLAIALPNFHGIYRMLGTRDPFLIPPIHLNYFTPASLRRMLNDSGFDVVKMATTSWITTGDTLSKKRRAIGSAWNKSMAPLLGFTRIGIFLMAFATPR